MPFPCPAGVPAGRRDHPVRHVSQGLPPGLSGARAGGAARGQVDVSHLREGRTPREAAETVRRRAPGVLPVSAGRDETSPDGRGIGLGLVIGGGAEYQSC